MYLDRQTLADYEESDQNLLNSQTGLNKSEAPDHKPQNGIWYMI